MLFGKKRISVCFVDSSNLGSVVAEATKELNEQYGERFLVDIIPLGEIGAPATAQKWIKRIEQADLVLVDIRGTNPLIKVILDATRRGKATVASLLGGSFQLMGLTRMGIFDADKFFNGPIFKRISAKGGNAFAGVTGETDFDDIDAMLKKQMPGFVYKDVGAWFEVTRYWGINGKENVKRLLVFMGRNYCRMRGLPKPLPPLREPSPAIRHPRMEKLYTDLQEYLDDYGYEPQKPTAVLISYDGMHMENCLVPTKALVEALEPAVNVVPISCDGMKNVAAVRSLMFPEGEFFGDILVPLIWFRFNGGPIGGTEDKTYDLFREINVPVFHPITAFNQPYDEWLEEKAGVSPVEFLANVTLPECDGAVEPVIICAKDVDPTKPYSPIIAIPDRVQRCAGRIKRMLALRRKTNDQKKITLIVYNYPPGEHNLGNAAYLDTFESVRNILQRMKSEGYDTGEIPENLSELFLETGIVNSPEWTAIQRGVVVDSQQYESLMAEDSVLAQDIQDGWGVFPGRINSIGNSVILPMVTFGKVNVALQPSRGFHEDEEQNYHDKSIPPHHQYAAFYKWLQQTQDAIVHVGTHGTLEFLRGKEHSIASEDDMDILLGDLPHFYIYQTGNPSEAMIAKRRSLATMISYAPPTADSSGLYGEYLAMQDLFDELQDARHLEPSRQSTIEAQIRAKAKENGWEDLAGDLEAIESRLTSMSRSLIPVGLRTFGVPMDEEEQAKLIAAALRYDRGETKALNRLLAEQAGFDYEQLLEDESPQLIALDEQAKTIVRSWLASGVADEQYAAQFSLAQSILSNTTDDYELVGLMNALNAGYADAGLAADALRNPEVFPSGRNLYQFNPLTLPTESAMERGKQIARNTLKHHFETTGQYPKSVGVVLWGFETAKTCGETVGQVFEYLGVRIKSEPGSWFPRVEPVPAAEMDHPRIDTMIEICGFFRDLFPNLLDMIDDGIRAVSELAEDDNAVREKSLAIAESLIADGVTIEEAESMSTLRIFGPPESVYGTSLTTMVETGRWADEEELGDAYFQDMRYAYGKGVRGKACPEINSLLLSQVEMISQIQDSYEYDVTDLDHYYEFFGGFARAVENARGEKPQLITTNTATERIRTEDVSEAIARGALTRTLNPKWIDAMLQHEYHGAQKVADRVEYLVGLSATTGAVPESVWEATAETLLFDEEMRQRLEENNRFAAHEIAKRLYEADRRGYWHPSEEEQQQLMDLLMNYEEDLEGED
jgi:cobaltochelatase CobN